MSGNFLKQAHRRILFRVSVLFFLTAVAGFLSLVLGMAVLSLSLAWLWQMSRPIDEVMTALEKLSTGNPEIRLQGLERDDELGRVSRQLWSCREAILRRREAEESVRMLLAERKAVTDSRQGLAVLDPDRRSELCRDEPITVPFDLESVLGGTAALLSPKAEEKGLEIIFDRDPGFASSLMGDPLRLSQILTSLIGNAIKFSKQGEIVLSLREKAREGDQVELHVSVRDQGAGLTPHQQSRLFQIFTQDDYSPRRDSIETGLGLAICARLVKLMGGSIWVESQYGLGSTFHFTGRFRINGDHSGQAPAYLEQLKSFSGRRVLVIDDSDTSRRVAGALLAHLGFVPDLFPSGRAALARLSGDPPPDYLFCCVDRAMPDLDGFRVARLLRTHYGRACPPMLLLSAQSPSLESRGANHEFAAVVSKPLGLEQLFHRVAAVLRVPIGGAAAEQVRRDRRTEFRLRGKRVLLVEHQDISREIVANLLRDADVQVQVAANGLEALQVVREEAPDCVLMDCHMPVMDGYETTAKLRSLGFTRLPVIALTTGTLARDRETCLAAGMNDVVSKPVSLSSLLRILAKWVALPGAGEGLPLPTWATSMELSAMADDLAILPPLPPGVDVESGLRRLRGRTELFLKALRMFRDSRGQQFQLEIRAAVAARDWQTSERLAHSLKSTAATIGANEVSTAAASLEAAIRDGNYGEVQSLLTEVTDKLQAIVDGLANIG